MALDFLEHFKSYYTNIAFGNPGYQAQRWAHKLKNAVRKSSGKESVRFVEQIGRSIDVRHGFVVLFCASQAITTTPMLPVFGFIAERGFGIDTSHCRIFLHKRWPPQI
jgi:hypothetical protein